jgi:hypothetical protein
MGFHRRVPLQQELGGTARGQVTMEDIMKRIRTSCSLILCVLFAACSFLVTPVLGQLIDKTKAPNVAGQGINKSLTEQVGAGRGDSMTPDSSCFIINRDPFRAIRRGRQLFQRKFTRAEGQGPSVGDGSGDSNTTLAIGASSEISSPTSSGTTLVPISTSVITTDLLGNNF